MTKVKTMVIVAAACTSLFLPHTALATSAAVATPTAPAFVSPGQQFIINIDLTPNNAIAGAQFSLSFNSTLVAAVSVAEGNLLRQDGANTYFSGGQINNNNGTITAVSGVIVAPGQSIDSAGTFAVITMTAKSASGTCPINLSNVVVGDMNGQALQVTTATSQVIIPVDPSIITASLPNGEVGATYRQTLAASSGTTPYLWSLSAGSLPAGLTLNTSTGAIGGTPTTPATSSFTVRLSDAVGGTTTRTFSIAVDPAASDVNTDGSINILDLIVIGQHQAETGPPGWIRADVNRDGTISVLDSILVGQRWTG
jgi:hypothetical protein